MGKDVNSILMSFFENWKQLKKMVKQNVFQKWEYIVVINNVKLNELFFCMF